jgi:hypothetical protein
MSIKIEKVRAIVLLVLLFSLNAACLKGRAPEGGASQANANANANIPVYAQQNLPGDVERASLAVQTAIDHHNQNKWDEAAAQLRVADSELERGLTRKPRLQPEFEDCRSRIQNVLASIERRDPETKARLQELMVAVTSLKGPNTR